MTSLAWLPLPFILARRTLRSGKEFSIFDLAIGAAIEPAEFFDVEVCLANHLGEDESAPIVDPAAELLESPPFWINTPSTDDPTPIHPSHSTANALKAGSKRRRREKRAAAGAAAKSVTLKHLEASLKHAVNVDINAAELSHSKPAWIGLRSAEDESQNGMGGRPLSIPIIDSNGRIIAVLGGMPRDVVGWERITGEAATLLDTRVKQGSFNDEQIYHRRAQEPYPSISRGISHGGGQTEPGELCNNPSNTRLTDELLQQECFQRLAGFANCLFATFAPVLFAFYQVQMAMIAEWRPRLRWNFARSVFAACTFNFGPHAITVPHLDFGNLAWGWCAITALGTFDPDVGGHLILWDLKLVIRFPPGSTILIPSAIIRHSNVPVGLHERRFSFTQYTAGGLFRWIRNGFKTDEAFQESATPTEKATRRAEDLGRWEAGVAMYRTVDTLCP
ncbi:hypothetical protein B0H13DRAFT_2325383 [Mycena leptocephala]|nr:hypothetical protein B0H13DRAFT_2325383 [Mycena leptocephala]